MHRSWFSFALSLLVATPVFADVTSDLIEQARRAKKSEMDFFYESTSKGELDPAAAWTIPARTIELPWGVVTLDGGTIIPLKAAELDKGAEGKEIPERKWIGAVYVGAGSFHWDTPSATDAWLIAQNLKTADHKKGDPISAVDVHITEGAVVLLNGSWRALLEEGGTKVAADKKIAATAKKLWKERSDLYLSSSAQLNTVDLWNGRERGFLTLDMKQDTLKDSSWLTYDHDPNLFEGTSLQVIKRFALNRDSLDIINFGKGPNPAYVKKFPPKELALMATYSPIDVQHYKLDLRVTRDDTSGDWGMLVTGDMEIGIREDARVIELEFANTASYDAQDSGGASGVIAPSDRPMAIHLLTDGDGTPLKFLHRKDRLVVQLPRPMTKGETLTLKMKYDGNFIFTRKQPTPSTSLTSDEGRESVGIISWEVPVGFPWYPSNGTNDFITFDWTLRLPKPMLAATSGTLLSMVEEGGFNVHTIKETVPEVLPAIVFGRFSVTENNPDYSKGEVKIRLYTHPGFDKEAQSFIDEAASIIRFYESRFGKYPFSELDMAQMAIGMGFAQAPAGLIRVTGEVYVSKTDLVNLWGYSDPQLRDYFIPHEIGHEWWGHKANFGTTPRDQWISETFAEFSAALYVEERDAQKKKDPNWTAGYTERMTEWKTQRNGHKTKYTAPLWVGDQMSGEEWQSTVYARGPLILDMLRREIGKEALLKAMFTFCELSAAQGNLAITEDWQTILEKVLPGRSFQELMDKFIKGNEQIPDPPPKKG